MAAELASSSIPGEMRASRAGAKGARRREGETRASFFSFFLATMNRKAFAIHLPNQGKTQNAPASVSQPAPRLERVWHVSSFPITARRVLLKRYAHGSSGEPLLSIRFGPRKS
jgi:hypothetical protein